MRIEDPFPRHLYLTHKDVAELLRMDRWTLVEWLKDPTTNFPQIRKMGKNRNGSPRFVWKKSEVYAWIEITNHGVEQKPAESG